MGRSRAVQGVSSEEMEVASGAVLIDGREEEGLVAVSGDDGGVG
jgi:hypothetical protein